MSADLLPCPFCGGTEIDPEEWSNQTGLSGPGCSSCGAVADSAAAWNRRAPVQAQGVALLSGWTIEGGAVDLVVKKPGVGGYWAERDSSNIAPSILFHFASDMLAQAAPTSDALVAARAKGRAEALDIIMGVDPEDGISAYIGWHTSGAPEDEGSSHWDSAKLRELLHVDSALADMQDKAESEYYKNLNLREEAERLHAAALLAHEDLRDQVGQAINDEIQRAAPEPDWNDSREIDRLADAAMLVLLERSTYGQHERTELAKDAARWRLARDPKCMEIEVYVSGNQDPLCDSRLDAAVDAIAATRSAK